MPLYVHLTVAVPVTDSGWVTSIRTSLLSVLAVTSGTLVWPAGTSIVPICFPSHVSLAHGPSIQTLIRNAFSVTGERNKLNDVPLPGAVPSNGFRPFRASASPPNPKYLYPPHILINFIFMLKNRCVSLYLCNKYVAL